MPFIDHLNHYSMMQETDVKNLNLSPESKQFLTLHVLPYEKSRRVFWEFTLKLLDADYKQNQLTATSDLFSNNLKITKYTVEETTHKGLYQLIHSYNKQKSIKPLIGVNNISQSKNPNKLTLTVHERDEPIWNGFNTLVAELKVKEQNYSIKAEEPPSKKPKLTTEKPVTSIVSDSNTANLDGNGVEFMPDMAADAILQAMLEVADLQNLPPSQYSGSTLFKTNKQDNIKPMPENDALSSYLQLDLSPKCKSLLQSMNEVGTHPYKLIQFMETILKNIKDYEKLYQAVPNKKNQIEVNDENIRILFQSYFTRSSTKEATLNKIGIKQFNSSYNSQPEHEGRLTIQISNFDTWCNFLQTLREIDTKRKANPVPPEERSTSRTGSTSPGKP